MHCNYNVDLQLQFICIIVVIMKFKKTEQGRHSNSYLPDWKGEGVWIEVKTRLQAIRGVRDGLFQLAHALAEKPGLHGFLFLIDPSLTESRLFEEWEKVERIFRHDIISRLKIFVYKTGHIYGIPTPPDPKLCDELKLICKDELTCDGILLPNPDFNFEVIKILIYQWLMKKGPMTSNWIAETAGCNYRTVANTLESLGNAIVRLSDRRVELRYFPKDDWARLIAISKKSRVTRRFIDSSGQPRSIESMLQRIKKMGHPEIAVGGILGARQFYPEIDLVGTPRLDLSVHCPDKNMDITFIELLDPALKREDAPDIPAVLVLHFIRRRDSFFKIEPNGASWADPVECLLDLHEMRLESQALEFLNALRPKEEI